MSYGNSFIASVCSFKINKPFFHFMVTFLIKDMACVAKQLFYSKGRQSSHLLTIM